MSKYRIYKYRESVSEADDVGKKKLHKKHDNRVQSLEDAVWIIRLSNITMNHYVNWKEK